MILCPQMLFKHIKLFSILPNYSLNLHYPLWDYRNKYHSTHNSTVLCTFVTRPHIVCKFFILTPFLCAHTSTQYFNFKPPIPHQNVRKLATPLFLRAAPPGLVYLWVHFGSEIFCTGILFSVLVLVHPKMGLVWYH